jgi:hypothetical protein
MIFKPCDKRKLISVQVNMTMQVQQILCITKAGTSTSLNNIDYHMNVFVPALHFKHCDVT